MHKIKIKLEVLSNIMNCLPYKTCADTAEIYEGLPSWAYSPRAIGLPELISSEWDDLSKRYPILSKIYVILGPPQIAIAEILLTFGSVILLIPAFQRKAWNYYEIHKISFYVKGLSKCTGPFWNGIKQAVCKISTQFFFNFKALCIRQCVKYNTT